MNIRDKKLIFLEGFVALTAMAGGIQLTVAKGAGMSVDALAGSPFHSYVIPGIILFLLVGGVNAIAAVFEIRKQTYRHEASAAAGFAVLIWIFSEVYILHESNWLQMLYFGIGTAILILVLRSQKSERAG